MTTIEEDPLLFPYAKFGSADKNKKNLVLVAGFPDDCISAWGNEVIDKLAKDYNIICLCLPGYAKKKAKSWGYKFPELISMMHKTITTLLPKSKYYLVGHDWGSLIVQLYQAKYPEDILKMALIDVGQNADLFNPRILIYQSWFATSYVLSQLLGHQIGQLVFSLFFIIGRIIPYINPTPHDRVHRPMNEIDCTMCYPYYHLHRAVYTGELKSLLVPFPSCPLLYIYGTKKGVMFHGNAFLKKIHETIGCQHIASHAGHWLHYENPDVFVHDLKLFFP